MFFNAVFCVAVTRIRKYPYLWVSIPAIRQWPRCRRLRRRRRLPGKTQQIKNIIFIRVLLLWITPLSPVFCSLRILLLFPARHRMYIYIYIYTYLQCYVCCPKSRKLHQVQNKQNNYEFLNFLKRVCDSVKPLIIWPTST